jgi:hypothetical protein
MSILGIVIVIAIVGVLLYAVNAFLPIDPKLKTLLHIVVVLILLLWLLNAFGGASLRIR